VSDILWSGAWAAAAAASEKLRLSAKLLMQLDALLLKELFCADASGVRRRRVDDVEKSPNFYKILQLFSFAS
jgi:hypothetical protein